MGMNIAFFLLYYLSRVQLLPIKDDRGRFRSFPFMTTGIVFLNVLVFIGVNIVLALAVGAEAWNALVSPFLLLPADIGKGMGLGALSLITSAFLHADLMHLLGNMFLLFFFGRKLEDVLGPFKFGVFYLVCIFVSGTVHVVGEIALPITQGARPALGASGAIMGIVTAYIFLYHDQRIRTVIFGFLPIPETYYFVPFLAWPRLPAWVFIIVNVTQDILGAWLAQTVEREYGIEFPVYIAWFVHLGGVLAGLTCLYLFLPAEIIHYRRQIGEDV
jgi:membrane associated rhomboid family serine protease